jgi:hypothetical protein
MCKILVLGSMGTAGKENGMAENNLRKKHML